MVTRPPRQGNPMTTHGVDWKYLHELDRLRTFVTWPRKANISTIGLASKGFIYIGNGENCTIKCCFCAAILDNLICIEDTRGRHRSRCPITTGVMCSNIPIATCSPGNMKIIWSQFNAPRDTSILSNGRDKVITRSQPEDQHASSSVVTSMTYDDDTQTTDTCQYSTPQTSGHVDGNGVSIRKNEVDGEFGVVTEKCQIPQYRYLGDRLDSFNKWPQRHHVDPKVLAKAGFFYTGTRECVQCFYCAGCVRLWNRKDDVWVTHARLFPTCPFVVLEKEHEFVKTVLEMGSEMNDNFTHDDVMRRIKANARGKFQPDNDLPQQQQTRAKCYICHAGKFEVLFFPCRHSVCCTPCSENVTSCPRCHREIKGTKRVFV